MTISTTPARDSWGNESKPGECACTRDGGRTTWHLCGRPAKGIIERRDGTRRLACGVHLAAARRFRGGSYSTEPVALYDLDGKPTDSWESTSGVRGYFAPLT